MRLLISIIVTLFISVWVALSLREEPGYAMFSMGQLTIETSLTFFIIFVGPFLFSTY
jgi:HemY protein